MVIFSFTPCNDVPNAHYLTFGGMPWQCRWQATTNHDTATTSHDTAMACHGILWHATETPWVVVAVAVPWYAVKTHRMANLHGKPRRSPGRSSGHPHGKLHGNRQAPRQALRRSPRQAPQSFPRRCHCDKVTSRRGVASRGKPWQTATVDGKPWQATAIHGNPSQAAVIHDKPWKSMAIHGNPWQSMASRGNPWQP